MSVSQTTLARMEQHVPIYPETTSVIVQRDGKGKIATKVSLLFSILLPLRFDKRYLPGSISYVHMYACALLLHLYGVLNRKQVFT